MFKGIGLLQGNVVRLSHEIFQEILTPGDTVVDATCGNGKDCLILARLLKGKGKLVAYDVQREALEKASLLCSSSLSSEERSIIEFKEMSHEYINEAGAKLFHYNLGYLPNGDKSVTTLETSTLVSVQKALDLVAPRGMITVVCYPGHEEGANEMVAVERLASGLDSRFWEVGSFYIMNRNKAPRLLIFRSLKVDDKE
ncbi:class I SAM-dependent methyltransferase [Chlamydia crocodili]|uniref:Class I SAM-dependent methyltransferase n=1 Tax=Chlamydia crocodili TaxID=2766982 RepID=A0ABX8CJE8_9CHLA|nr:class I SAM-dependent methyltransferase [Chlamydia crocodili]QVE49302.1 class I SAM-dependent methyltransferase [Chlamydia crocodili]